MLIAMVWLDLVENRAGLSYTVCPGPQAILLVWEMQE